MRTRTSASRWQRRGSHPRGLTLKGRPMARLAPGNGDRNGDVSPYPFGWRSQDQRSSWSEQATVQGEEPSGREIKPLLDAWGEARAADGFAFPLSFQHPNKRGDITGPRAAEPPMPCLILAGEAAGRRVRTTETEEACCSGSRRPLHCREPWHLIKKKETKRSLLLGPETRPFYAFVAFSSFQLLLGAFAARLYSDHRCTNPYATYGAQKSYSLPTGGKPRHAAMK